MIKPTLCILLFFVSCTSKTKKSTEVSIKVERSAFQGTDKVESLYELTEGTCRIIWQTTSVDKDKISRIHLMNRSDCKLPFPEAAKNHEKVLKRILKDYSPADIKFMLTGGLSTLQPDGSWNLIVAKEADKSAEYQDFRKNYPNHKSKRSSNDILVDIIRHTQAHKPFKDMFKKFNLKFELESVEKVFSSTNEKGQAVINDAGMLWWKAL